MGFRMCNCLVYVTLALVIQHGHHVANAVYWMSMGTQTNAIANQRLSKSFCNTLSLHEDQIDVCRNYTDLIPSVAQGIRWSIEECQDQFTNRKWNCSIMEGAKTIFGPILKTASRESAFINGITSAGVAFSVTEACAEGRSLHCRCDNRIRGITESGWKWGGCNRPISYGIFFSELFIDNVEKQRKKRDPRRAMNLHNNKAGREIIRHNLWTKCKCHGMSGNCNLKTCWLAQPKFAEVGKMLKERYDSAHEMDFQYKIKKKNGKKRFKKLVPKYKEYLPPSTLDFIYFQDSPDYCKNDDKAGIVGTAGRRCNITSSGVDGCEQMCCRRGYNVNIVQETKSCHCKFIWCCQVKCQSCTEAVPKYTCK